MQNNALMSFFADARGEQLLNIRVSLCSSNEQRTICAQPTKIKPIRAGVITLANLRVSQHCALRKPQLIWPRRCYVFGIENAALIAII